MVRRPLLRIPPRRGEPDEGFALVATLIVVVILALLATLVVTSLSRTSPSSPGNTIPGAGGTTIPTNAANGAQLAAVASCQADFASVTTAVTTYQTLNGSNPPAGTGWATSTADNGPILSPWPSDPGYFTLTWNGSEVSVIPAHGAASHGSPGTSTPKTGCNAS